MTNAIKIINTVFAQFIYNNGKLRLIINNVLSPEDKENLLTKPEIINENEIKKINTKIKNSLSRIGFSLIWYAKKINKRAVKKDIIKRCNLLLIG